MQVLRTKQVKQSTKRHTCDQCENPIQVGNTYYKQSIKYGLGVHNIKVCEKCEKEVT